MTHRVTFKDRKAGVVDEPIKRRWWLARWRASNWQKQIEDNGSRRWEAGILRLKLHVKGAILTVTGIAVGSWTLAQAPGVVDRIIAGLAALAFTGVGLILIYFGLWSEADRT